MRGLKNGVYPSRGQIDDTYPLRLKLDDTLAMNLDKLFIQILDLERVWFPALVRRNGGGAKIEHHTCGKNFFSS